MIKPYHIYLSAILLIVSRSVFAERTFPIDPSNTPQESLNTLLSCGKYTRLQGYFGIPGAGCLYRGGKNNQLGNAEIFLVPKSGFITTPYKEDPEEENRINTQGNNYIFKNYNIYLVLVSKKFINLTHGNTEYYPEYPYEQFTFENTNGHWEAISWRIISSKADLDWDYYWRDSYIKHQNQNSETKNKHAQCLSTLKSFISTSDFPLHGVKAENLKFYIYRDYSGKMIGFHAYFLMKDGYEGNDFDRKKNFGEVGSGEIYLDTLEFEFVTSPFRNEHTNFIARHPLAEYNKTQITELKDCDFPSIEYGGRQTHIYMQVISKGRTYFHETPHNETRIKDLFLIPGDKVTPDYRDGDFTFVWYTQKSGNQVSGWLKTEDLMEIPSLD